MGWNVAVFVVAIGGGSYVVTMRAREAYRSAESPTETESEVVYIHDGEGTDLPLEVVAEREGVTEAVALRAIHDASGEAEWTAERSPLPMG